MDEDFYYAFEERHRGSRELIKSRLTVYLPFLHPFKEIYEKPLTVIDLGCGRGEWLELMLENGFEPKGVDISDRMIEICRQRGFYVEKQDAVKALEDLPSDSHVVVSAFHLVEHIPFNDVYKLVKEALRVLKPGGILILETPNPENLVVASTSFYMDPTHVRPVPPLLLSFLVEYCGFFRHRILRLQESPEILKHGNMNLWNVLSGVSPDYAIVAQKDAEEKRILSHFDTLFNSTSVGVTLDQLVVNYERELENKIVNPIIRDLTKKNEELSYQLGVLTETKKRFEEELERERRFSSELRSRIEEVIMEAEAERARANELGERLSEAIRSKEELSYQLGILEEELERERRFSSELRSRIEEVIMEAEAERARANELETKCASLEHTVQALYRSWSWRVTYPLRLGLDTLRASKRISIACLTKIWGVVTYPVKWILAKAIKFVLNRPRLREFLHRQLVHLPWIYWRLYNFAVNKGVVVSEIVAIPQQSPRHDIDFTYDLSPRARQIYEDLKRAIENRRKDSIG